MPPKTHAPVKSGKATKVNSGDKKMRKAKRKESYGIYIYKVLVTILWMMFTILISTRC